MEGSVGYARALARARVIMNDERDVLIDGLGEVGKEWECGVFVVKVGDEDIYIVNEWWLMEFIGDVAGKLYIGRSRND